MAFQKCDMQPPGADIREEIARGGPITFARFMELALYAPGCGYYERPREIGRRGDFFTSVSVGPVFGGLLAFQFARWLEEIAPPAGGHWQLVEAGAHDGRLALDVLRWLRQRRPGVLARLEYWIIEPSPERRAWQERKLSNEFRNVKWARAFGRPGSPPVRGVIFCNEMLDAMPVHRLCRDAPGQQWLEWRVNWSAPGFVWQKGPLSKEAAAALPRLPAGVEAVLPDGYVIEISPAALQWWSRAAASLSAANSWRWTTVWTGRNGSIPRAAEAHCAPTPGIMLRATSWAIPANRTSPRTSTSLSCGRRVRRRDWARRACSGNRGS